MPKENSLLQEIGQFRRNEEMKKPKNKRVSSLRKGSEGVEVHGQCRSACISAKKFQRECKWSFSCFCDRSLEIKQNVIKESENAKFEASHHHVFLLGENRWEDSSKLVGRNKEVSASKVGIPTTKSIACRGEGRILCIECDGTGEPNIEPQFLEWVDEGTKCPYCDGLGYNICDVCEGKILIRA